MSAHANAPTVRRARQAVLDILTALQAATPDEREEIARICSALTPNGNLSLTEMAEQAMRGGGA